MPDRRSRRRQRGAASVEMALLVAPLLLLTFGALELGMAWMAKGSVEHAARSASITGARLTEDPAADRDVLSAVVSGLASDRITVDAVMVWDATAHATMPSACRTTSMSGCNRYDATSIAALDTPAAWGCGPAAHDRWFCPTTRRSTVESPRHIGVTVTARHPYLTGVLPAGGIDIEVQSISMLVTTRR
jgi:hypothetical protein